MSKADGSRPLYWSDQEIDLSFARRVGPAAVSLQSCIQCGSCTAACPTANRTAISPQRLGRLIRLGLKDEIFASGSFWQCTSCAACALYCPRGIPFLDIVIDLKRYARSLGFEPPEEVRLLCEAVRLHRNISGEPNEERLRWSTNLPQPLADLNCVRGVDVVYFVGCIAAFYPRAYGIAQCFGRLLSHSGLRFTTLAGNEWCCGYPLFNAGLDDEIGPLLENNLTRLRELGATTLVTTCPTCFYTWAVLYPRYAALPAGLRIMHSSQLLSELVDAGKLCPGPLERVVTYHDPCDLGRKSGEFQAPRDLLCRVPGLELREMANSRINSLCCGGGGDVKLLDLDTSLDVALRRVDQALDVGADTVVSTCQQCKRAMVSAVQWMRKPLKVQDIVELLWESVADEVEW